MTEAGGLGRVELGDVALREDEGGDGRTVDGYAYRWGDLTQPGATIQYPGLREGFERGAFADLIAARGERPWPFLDVHRGRTVAGIRFDEDDTGLHYRGRLLDTAAANEYAATIPAGNDGVSLEFAYRGAVSKRVGDTILHTKVPYIAALAGTYAGAYTDASVALRSEGETMELETVDTAPVVAGPLPLSREQVMSIAQDVATEAM